MNQCFSRLDSTVWTLPCFSMFRADAILQSSWGETRTQPDLSSRLIIALDDVLVSSTIFKPFGPSELVEYETQDGRFTFYVTTRDGVHEFLAAVAPELVLLTTAAAEYVDAVLPLVETMT